MIEPYYEESNVTIYLGDALDTLRQMEAESVQCVVTSPPYYGLRNYQVEGQIGLEETPEDYVAKMVEVFAEVKRVLKNDGVLWLNMGDSYGQQQGKGFPGTGQVHIGENNRNITCNTGLPPKNLLGIPWRLALARCFAPLSSCV